MTKYSVVLIGGPGVGKTNLFNQLSNSEERFQETPPLLSGTQTETKYLKDNPRIGITYCDFGSGSNSATINTMINGLNTEVIGLVFDATDPNWLTHLENYLAKMNIAKFPEAASIILIGNKIDMLKEGQAEIHASADNYIKRHYGDRGQYIAVSAKTGANLSKLSEVIENILRDLNAELEPFLEGKEDGEETFISDRSDSDENGSPRRDSIGGDEIDTSPYVNKKKQRLSYGSNTGSLLQISPVVHQSSKAGSVSGKTQSASNNNIARRRTSNGSRKEDVLTLLQVTPRKDKGRKEARSLEMPSIEPVSLNDSHLAFFLRLVGMTLILAALINLIYVTMVAAGFLSSVLLISTVNQIMVTVGGLLAMSAPAAILSNFCATLGVSTLTGSALLATGASLATMGLGFALRSLGQPNNPAETLTSPPSTLSSVLQWVGMALMLAATVNLIYLILVGVNVLSPILLTTGMNNLLASCGGLLGVSASEAILAYGNACAAVGLTTTFASGVISAGGGLLFAGVGYSLFQSSRRPLNDVSENTNTRAPQAHF